MFAIEKKVVLEQIRKAETLDELKAALEHLVMSIPTTPDYDPDLDQELTQIAHDPNF